MRRKTAGCGKVFAVDASINWAADFTSSTMSWDLLDANATLLVVVGNFETFFAKIVSGLHNL